MNTKSIPVLDDLITAPLLLLQDMSKTHPLLSVASVWLLSTKYVSELGIPTAATDGTRVIINPLFFERMNTKTRAHVLAHEALHGIFEHMPQMKAFGPEYKDISEQGVTQRKANIAMDIIINGMLQHEFGERFQWTDENGKECYPCYIDTKFNNKYIVDKAGRDGFNLDDCDFYYVFKHLTQEAGDGSGGGEGLEGGSDVVVGDASTQTKAEANAKRAIAQAEAMAKYQQWGDMPGWMSRIFSNLSEPKVNWRKELYDLHTSMRPVDYSFAKLKRPYVFFGAGCPTVSVPGLGQIAMFIDTSGSITAEMLTDAASELHSIWKTLRPECIHIAYVDAEVANTQCIGPDDEFTLEPKGGGGTDFRPAFDWVEKEALDIGMGIYFTDGYGSFPDKEPPYPVIWLVLAGGAPDESFPFGRVLRLGE
jgi:predicted metal-dependent peptidase